MFLILNKRHLYGGAAGHQSCQHGAIRYERIYWRPTLFEVLKTNNQKKWQEKSELEIAQQLEKRALVLVDDVCLTGDGVCLETHMHREYVDNQPILWQCRL